ncbi:MAG: hypothetical protein ACLTUD_09035 [Bifidobacterium catenulatum]
MNGHDSTREQNMEARMTLAAARRGLAAAINDAENGIGHLSCDDPKIMEQVRAHWRRLYDTYMNADAIIADLESCARHLTDGDKWEPNPIADGMKPMEMAKGCACFIAETPDGVLIIPSEPTPGENTAKRLANTLNALTGDVLLDATGIRLLGTQFLFSTHYPELLDHFTRKDSIWFAVRDGKGFALRNLGAYLGRTDLKKSVSFFANRVPGTAPSYAAVRALQDYAERYVHA